MFITSTNWESGPLNSLVTIIMVSCLTKIWGQKLTVRKKEGTK